VKFVVVKRREEARDKNFSPAKMFGGVNLAVVGKSTSPLH
jgi:hypothetical protein